MSYSNYNSHIPEVEAVALQPQLELSGIVAASPAVASPVGSTIHPTASAAPAAANAPGRYSSLAGDTHASPMRYHAHTADSYVHHWPPEEALARGPRPDAYPAMTRPDVMSSIHHANPLTVGYAPPLEFQNIPMVDAFVVDQGYTTNGHVPTVVPVIPAPSQHTTTHAYKPLSLSDRTTQRQTPYVLNPLPSSALWQSNQYDGRTATSSTYVRPGSNMKPYV